MMMFWIFVAVVVALNVAPWVWAAQQENSSR